MARVLIGWELGANRGHIVRLLHYHDALVAAGHEVSLALQRIDGAAREGRAVSGAVWQAPLWPRLIGSNAHRTAAAVATLGDILARVGLADPGALASLIGGWDRLLAAARPDLVVADYAPALLAAARGRVPSIAVGYGFDVPPAAMERFPSLSGEAALYDEAALLDRTNAELAAAGRAPLAALPELFAADHEIPAILAALDPYAAWRSAPVAAPALGGPLPPISDGTGDELFVYWPEHRVLTQGLWDGLRAAGVPVRLYMPGLDDVQAAQAEALGFAVERKSMKWDRIRARARVVLSHGGGGFVTMAMLVGVPQIVCHYDLEKRGNGEAAERLGVGKQAPLHGLEGGQVAELVGALWDSGTARAKAAGLRAGMGRPAEEELAAAAARLSSESASVL